MQKKLYILLAICSTLPFFISSSCNNGCPVNKVTLTSFLSEITNQTPAMDPLGGYIFIYWIDGNGNVCHGEPGVSGQPGPIVINAFSQEAYDAARAGSVFTEDQLRQYQDFIYSNAKYNVSGTHFVQFDNVIWRSRSDGKVFMDRGFHLFSKPVIADPGTTVCLNPVYPASDEHCGKYQGLFIPNPLPVNTQHPTIGLTKSQPASTSLSDAELMNYCLLKLPHGLEITE